MAETLTKSTVIGLVPLEFAADVQRAIDFYKLLGMEVHHSLRNSSGQLKWVFRASDHAELMLSIASDPVIASQQAVLFYLYSPDLIGLRAHLLARGIKVSPITYPDYTPKGEIRVDDPDGYCLLIGQAV
jgi:catechol 2,3-dioxygenase-like lactoylglutathione lyase family enzyme